MQHPGLVIAPGASAPQPAAAAVRAWSVGQVLAARVLEAPAGGAVVLAVGSQRIEAHSQVPLHPGQALQLRVEEAGARAVLRIVPGPAPHSDAALAATVLRGALPRAEPLAQALTTLQRLAGAPAAGGRSPAAQAARAMITDLLASLPAPADAADPGRLAAMVRASGLFHEALQARAGDAAAARGASQGADLKARLAALADVVTGAVGEDGPLGEAEGALRGALARIEANQAASVRASGEHAALWQLDLPLAGEQGPQDLRLRIARDSRGRCGDAQVAFVAELVLQPPGLAPVHARVSLRQGRVFALLTTESEDTLQRLQGGAAELERLLDEVGLSCGGVRCRRAPLPDHDAALAGGGLVSERA